MIGLMRVYGRSWRVGGCWDWARKGGRRDRCRRHRGKSRDRGVARLCLVWCRRYRGLRVRLLVLYLRWWMVGLRSLPRGRFVVVPFLIGEGCAVSSLLLRLGGLVAWGVLALTYLCSHLRIAL